jgi:hypothetical protein
MYAGRAAGHEDSATGLAVEEDKTKQQPARKTNGKSWRHCSLRWDTWRVRTPLDQPDRIGLILYGLLYKLKYAVSYPDTASLRI